ncbi:DNA-binding FadR family transcriptional regulator [Maribacter vaceletii]|uniref:DNA-binding FadR family transcriptional regulator n=1 Tax=Maribacter vaceletii TaxID=1206816 RepID=A0A495EC26_9FLAO|nr:FadR/GntR family transcriptional regulator [Maribacter vaceletii]RKR14376.1 DNA-binding FadR family transcriptional regulator [Maribacter vaceletii]
MFSPVGNSKSLSQQIEEKITEAIRNGQYLPGQKIPTEKELCEIFKVSRTAVREAIKTLAARGIIVVKKGSGAYVSEVSIQNASESLNMFFELSSNKDLILQTIKTRQLIEPIIASEAAKHRTKKHITLLQKNLEDIKKCDLLDSKTEAELDNAFHKILVSIPQNNILELLLSPIFNLMPKFKESVFAKPTDGDLLKEKEMMIIHHSNILNAIIDQNGNLASQSMKNHLATTHANYIKSQALKK